jgi:hypothetical protein
MREYSQAAWERAMKIQEVILRAMAKRITWWQAAERMRFRGTLAGWRVTICEHLDGRASMLYGPHVVGRFTLHDGELKNFGTARGGSSPLPPRNQTKSFLEENKLRNRTLSRANDSPLGDG